MKLRRDWLPAFFLVLVALSTLTAISGAFAPMPENLDYGAKAALFSDKTGSQHSEIKNFTQLYIPAPPDPRRRRPIGENTTQQEPPTTTTQCPEGQWYDPERGRCVVPGDGDADVEQDFRNQLRSECQFPCGDGWCCPNDKACGRCARLTGSQKTGCYQGAECWRKSAQSTDGRGNYPLERLKQLVGSIEKGSEPARQELNGLCRDSSTMNQIRAAAENGNADAQFAVGRSYHLGIGVAKDFGLARYWYEKAAAQESAGAECNLGFLHHGGKGVPRDRSMARYWFKRAAQHGDSDAQRMLAREYGD